MSQLVIDVFQGLAFLEPIMAPYTSWDIFPKGGKDSFQAMRSEKGEDMLLKKNFFVGKSWYILESCRVVSPFIYLIFPPAINKFF